MMETVYVTAEQLIARHLDLHGALREACDTSNGKQMMTMSTSDAISLVKAQASLLGQQASLLATAHVAKGLLEIVGTSIQDHAYLLQQHEKEVLDLWVNLAVVFRSSFLMHSTHLITCLLRDITLPPLELLWTLHAEGLVDFQEILTRMDEEGRLPTMEDHLVSSVVALSRCEGPRAKEVITGVAGFLVALGLGPHEQRGNDGAVREHALIAAQRIVEDTYSPAHYSLCVCSPLEVLAQCPAISSAMATQFCISVLTKCVLTPPLEPVTSALSIYSSCSYNSQPLHCLALYKMIMAILGVDESIKCIQQLMEGEINWTFLLGFTACLLTTAPQALSDAIHNMVTMAVCDMESHTLCCALVLARHCAQEGSHLFPCYKDWFQQTFGSSHDTLLTSKRSLQFFFKCLKDVIPFEPAVCLKIHMSGLTKCVPNSYMMTDEYRVLARTRLDDLQEQDQPAEMCTSSSATPTSSHELQSALVDVSDALESFNKTGMVPQAIREAHMFRQPYFRHRFLPALLNPSPVSDCQDDVRERLIEAMLSAKLIPQKLVTGYRDAMAARLVQLRAMDEGGVQLMETTPLMSGLKLLVGAVKKGEVTPGLSALSAVMETHILAHQKSRKEDTIPSPVQLDLYSPGLCQWEVELVDSLLSTLLECILTQANKKAGFPWLQAFLHMFGRHRAVHVPFLVRLWELMHVQLPDLTDCQLTCLAILCSEMCNCSQPGQSISVINEMCSLCAGTSTAVQEMNSMPLYGSWLVSVLPHCTSLCALATFRFYCVFAEHSLSCHTASSQAVLQPIVVEKLHYLCGRYSLLEDHMIQEGGASIHDTQSQNRHLLSQWMELIQVYQGLCSAAGDGVFSHIQMPFVNWINNELAMYEDLLPGYIRCHYWRKTLYDHYLLLPTSSGGFGGDISGVFSQLYVALVKLDTWRPTSSSCICSGKGIARGWSNGVQLLQEVALSLSPGAEILHLTGAFQSEQQQDPREKEVALFHSYHCKLFSQAQLRVASCLPHYMFFCNSVDGHSTASMMDQTATLLECLPFFNDSYILPLDLTLHLLQGLCHLARVNTVPSREAADISQPPSSPLHFAHTCPLFGASLLAHWQHMRVAFQHTTIQAEIFAEVESISLWIQSSLQLPAPHLDWSEWPLAVGACLFHHLHTSVTSVVDVCARLKMKLPSLSGKTLCVLLWCALRDACVHLHTLLPGSEEESVPQSGWDPLSVSVGCITADPSTVFMLEGVLPDGQGLEDISLLADMRKHLPSHQVPYSAAILFMVISRVSRDVFRQLTLQPTFLKLCVRAHKLCLVGMESTCSGDERDNPCPALMPQPIISVGFIERCRVQTIVAIQQSPPLMVQGCLELCHDAIKPYCVAQTFHTAV